MTRSNHSPLSQLFDLKRGREKTENSRRVAGLRIFYRELFIFLISNPLINFYLL